MEASITMKSYLKTYDDFPTHGKKYTSIIPLIENKDAFTLSLDTLAKAIIEKGWKFDFIAGIEASGYIFGPTLASEFGCGFIPIRRKGKLPGKCLSGTYSNEYRQDFIEIQNEHDRKGMSIVIFDDALATGGTIECASNLLSQAGMNVVGCLFVIEFPFLGGKSKIKSDYCSIISMDK